MKFFSIKYFGLLFLGIIFISKGSLFAQNKDIEKKKAEIIWELPKYIRWNGGDEDIEVGVVGASKTLLRELRKYEKKKYPYGKSFKIISIEAPDEAAEFETHLLYIANQYNDKLEDIEKKVRVHRTVLITDDWKEKKSIMVNFSIIDGGLIYEVNARNLKETAKVTVLQKITKSEAKIIDDRYLLEESEQNLRDEKEKVKSQKERLERQLLKLKYQQKKIDRQIAEIDQQKADIEKQEQKLRIQRAEFAKLSRQTNIQRKELEEKTLVLKKKEKDIEIQNQKLIEQQLEAEKQNTVLTKQKEEIDARQKRIREQKITLLQQSSTIKIQKYALGIFLAFTIIVVVLIFFIFRQYRITRKQNKLLGAQKEEISGQAAQLELINTELEKLSIVASETSSAVIILDTEGNFEWVNAGFTRMYGFTLQLLRNELGENIFKASTLPNIEEYVKTCISEKKPIIYETFVKTRSGDEKWAQTTMSPTLNTHGEVSKLIIIDSDITEIKEAEAKILKQNQMILSQAKELEKLSVVASKTDNSVIIADATGEIEWVNAGFTRLLGLTFDEFKNEYGSNMYKASLTDDLKERVEKAVIDKQSIIYSAKTLTKDEKLIWIQTTLTPIVNPDGTLKRIIAIDADVTKIKLAEEQIAKQNKKITDSIIYAQRIQKAVLTPQEIISAYVPENFIMFRPRDIVSGDFYWAAQKGNKLIITAADCTGHGVPGAFMSMLGISFLNEIMASYSDDNIYPEKVLDDLRNKVKTSLRQTGKEGETKDGMDMALCVIDKNEMKMRFSGAQNSLILIRNSELTEYKADMMPIGISYDEKSFSGNEFDMQKGDTYYIYSDGYPDQFGEITKRKFFSKRLKMFLQKISNESIEEQKNLLEQNFDKWKGVRKQMDDVLVIGMKIS